MDTETYHFKIGKFQCIAINDGYISGIPIAAFFSLAPADQLRLELTKYRLGTETFSAPCVCLFVDTGQHRILVDVGGGPQYVPYGRILPEFPPLSPALGKLVAGLQAEGIAPASIDTVILSHMHHDHIAGCADNRGKPAFPNARYLASRGEWEGFMEMEIPTDPEEWGGWTSSSIYAQNQCRAIQDRIELFEGECELTSGICAFPTPGHTAHHYSFEFISEGEHLVCTMDTMAHPLHGEHPEWGKRDDIETEELIPSRYKVLKRANGVAWVHGFHFPFPGLGHFILEGDGWRWHSTDIQTI